MTKKNLLYIALVITLVLSFNAMGEELKSNDALTVPKSDETLKNNQAKVYTTAENTTMRLTQSAISSFGEASQPLETEVAIFVNPNKQFQEFLGIGGAITDASAEVFSKLTPKLRA